MTTDEAWSRYRQIGDPAARQFLVTTFSSLIQFALAQIHIPLGPTMQMEDAVSYGMIGLLDAMEKYDPNRGLKFETYAVVRIKGAIRDEIRKNQWLPRSIQEKIGQIDRTTGNLEEQLGRPPDHHEVAEALGIDLETYNRTMGEIERATILSFDDVIFESGDNQPITVEETVADPQAIEPHRYAEWQTVIKLIAQAIERLPEREQLAISLYFYEQLTLKEICQVMGISASRVAQLISQGLQRIRQHLHIPEPPKSRAGRPKGVDKHNNIYCSGNGSSSRTKKTQGGNRMAKVIVDENAMRVHNLLFRITSTTQDRTIENPDEILAAAKLNPHGIEVLQRQGALKRTGPDKWKVIEGVEFELVDQLPEEFPQPAPTSEPKPQEMFEPPIEIGKEELEMKTATELVKVTVGPVEARAYRLLLEAAKLTEQGQVVIGANNILTEHGLFAYTTNLKKKGLIEALGREGKATVWKINQVELEVIGAPAKPEEPKPPAPPVPEKPAEKRLPEAKRKKVAKQPAQAERKRISKPTAKPTVKTEEERPISVEDALFQRLILDHGKLRSAEELRDTAATLEKMARLAEIIAEHPEAFQAFMELQTSRVV